MTADLSSCQQETGIKAQTFIKPVQRTTREKSEPDRIKKRFSMMKDP